MNTCLSFIVFFFLLFPSQAQFPSYYVFSEEQFKGIDIYDVIQDDAHNYYFATDRGVFLHDGYSYEKIACNEMKGASVFNFVKDSRGVIYCCNLQRQIFRIRNQSIELFYEIPDYKEYFDVSLLITPKDELFIQGRGITLVAPDKSYTKEFLSDGTWTLRSNLLPNGEVATIVLDKSMAFLNGHSIESRSYKTSEILSKNSTEIPFTWLNIGDRAYAIDNEDMRLYLFDQNNKTFEYVKTLTSDLKGQVLRLFLAHDKIWLTGNSNGAYVFDSQFNPIYDGTRIYTQKYISDVFVDHEGNTLLGTFDEGILVVTDPRVEGINIDNAHRLTKMVPDENNGLFIGTNKGEIFHYHSGKMQLIFRDPSHKPIEAITYWQAQKWLVYSTSAGMQVSLWKNGKLTPLRLLGAAMKNGFFGPNDIGYVASNIGVYELKSTDGHCEIQRIESLKIRAHNVFLNPDTRTVYAGNSDGLTLLYPSGKTRIVRYKDSYIYPRSVAMYEDLVYVGTRKHGILIFKDDKIQGRIKFDDEIRKVIIASEKLFILTNSGLYISNLDGTGTTKMNKSSGLSFDHVTEFAVNGNTIYVTNLNTLESVQLEDLLEKKKPIPILFDEIRVNGAKSTTNAYSSNLRNLTFTFKVATLRYRENIHYEYQLKGYEKGWQKLNYADNQVVYNTLPAGEYTFVVRSVNGNTRSKEISYSFSIAAPYYQRWWFYILIIFLSGIIIASLFVIRIRAIRKKNKQRLKTQQMQTDVLESELKALRSQMNPHFIFNSLNSIQDLILQEDTDASYDYIVLFADLVRSTLNYSNADFIPFEKEIEFLDIYLSLEKLRFKEDFTYSIDVGNVDGIKVPSMLIQPFIENALLHGLLHKEGSKRLTISFELDEQLTCLVEDNGIGREKSKEIRDRQGQSHESFALEAIQKRLLILNEQLPDSQGSYTFEDLYDEQSPAGTRVRIIIPHSRQF